MRLRRVGPILLLAAAVATACGGDDGGGDSSAGISLEQPLGASAAAGEHRRGAGDAAVEKSGFALMYVPKAELDSAAQAVVDLATGPQVGGFLVSSVFDVEEGHGAARVVVSVPSSSFEAVVGKLGTIGEVRRQELQGRDLTPELVQSARSLQRARARTANLIARLERAEDEASRFELQEKLRAARATLRAKRQDVAAAEADLALATVEVDLRASPPPPPPQKPVIDRAIGTAAAITSGILSGAVLLAGVLVPITGLLAVVYVLGALVFRRLRPRLSWPG